MSLKAAAGQLGTIEKLFIMGVILFGAGISLSSTWTAIQESPQLLNQAMDSVNSVGEHVDLHHDSIVDLSVIVPQLMQYFEDEQVANIQRDASLEQYGQRQEYLICLREQRALEVNEEPTTRNCADELILGVQ